MREEIRRLLERFQEGYDLKKLEESKKFMDDIFASNTNIAILGTSDGEICLDYKSCEELFVSDWQYWGFEKLKVNDAVIKEFDKLTIVYVPANFKYTFDDNNQENRTSHFNDIIEMLSDEVNDKRDLKIKFGDINYELAHIYHNREGKMRTYRFDLKVCFILNEEYKALQINFSVPDNIKRPDARLYLNSHFNRYLDYELKKLISMNKNNNDLEVRMFIKDAFDNYFKTSSHFSSEKLLVVNVDDKNAQNIKELKTLKDFQNQYWDYLEIKDQEAYIEIKDATAIVITKAIAHSTREADSYFEETRKEILKLKDEELTVTEKMFKIRQLLAILYKETSISDQFENPIRVHMVLIKENNKWKINYLNMSYSFYYLLEDRNEFMKLI